MIGKLTGRVDYVAEDHALIETGGVGYVVHCSDRTLRSLPPSGEVAALYTELLVREDLLQLFGFATAMEREWHRLLISVQGVGAKVSLAILGALAPEGVGRAIALGDATAVRAAPGVGPKLAARIVNELKDKAPALMAMGAHGGATGGKGAPAAAVAAEPVPAGPAPADKPRTAGAAPRPDAARAEAQAAALSALINLGYGQSEAASAVATVSDSDDVVEERDLIRAALKTLAKDL